MVPGACRRYRLPPRLSLPRSVFRLPFCHLLVCGDDDTAPNHDLVDRLRPVLDIPSSPYRAVTERAGQDHGQPRRLACSQVGGTLREIMTRGRLDTKDSVPPFGDVQVELDDPPLGECPFQAPGQDRLLQFPERVLRRGQIKVLRQLLTDRAPPCPELPCFEVLFDRLLYRIEVEPLMGPELVILRDDYRLDRIGGNPFKRHPLLTDLSMDPIALPLPLTVLHKRGLSGPLPFQPGDIRIDESKGDVHRESCCNQDRDADRPSLDHCTPPNTDARMPNDGRAYPFSPQFERGEGSEAGRLIDLTHQNCTENPPPMKIRFDFSRRLPYIGLRFSCAGCHPLAKSVHRYRSGGTPD